MDLFLNVEKGSFRYIMDGAEETDFSHFEVCPRPSRSEIQLFVAKHSPFNSLQNDI
jgi:hypothetical protein